MDYIEHKLVVLIVILCLSVNLNAQITKKNYNLILDSLSSGNSALEQYVDISVSDISVKELIRILGNTTGLNVVVDPGINIKVNSNFNKVKAKDVISFLCSNYNLKLEPYGSILNLKPKVLSNNSFEIDYSPNDSILSYSVVNTPVSDFFEKLSNETDINFILNPSIRNLKLNGFAKNIKIVKALEQITSSNELAINKNESDLFVVTRAIVAETGKIPTSSRKRMRSLDLNYSNGRVDINVNECKITDVLSNIEEQSDLHFSFLNTVEDQVSIRLFDNDIESVLKNVFYGTKNTYKIDDNTVFVGSRTLPELKSCELIRLNNRRVDSLMHVLPKEFVQDLSIEEFYEQNSLIVWGDADKIYEFKKTIKEIDLPVPVVLIDVIIVDSSKSFGIETGIEAGLGDQPVQTKGSINPGLNLTMNAGSVNKFLDRVGLTNLGRVNPNFYLNLKAMESDGIIDIRSTPQLSTINGHTASLSVGQTEYYKEELSNIWGTQNPQLQTQSVFRPVEAKLQVIIKPFVTGNGHVSLDIDVEQSEFTARISENAPPGLVSRKFKSKISVKNQDMILLGGLEENMKSVTSSGWPLLSRIPVLKWIFSSRSDKKEKKHLNIFIKPTVFY